MGGELGPEATLLARRHRRIAAAGAGALLLFSAVLMERVYETDVDRVLILEASSAARRQAEIEGVVAAARGHVAAMQAAFLAAASRPAGLTSTPARAAGQASRAAGDPGLLSAPAPEDPHRAAFLSGPVERLAARAATDPELLAAESLPPLIAAAHAAEPALRWSYYFSLSRDFVLIWPWGELEDFVGPQEGRREVFDGYFDYDIVARTLREVDPERKAVWSGVYVDAGGAGLMVSHTAPADLDGRQLGIVGTDVVLKVFSDLLAPRPGEPGLLALDDGEGRVVADSGGVAAGAPEVTALASLLPPAAPGPEIAAGFRRAGEAYVLALPVAGTPWTLHRSIPAGAVARAALASLWPYAIFLVAVLAALFAAYLQIARGFVAPAIRLAALLERLAGDRPPGDLDAFPPGWRGWANRLVAAHRGAAESTARLTAAERKTRAILEAALDAVVTADAHGRVVDFSPAAERIFGRPAAEARGRRIGDLIVPPALRAAHEAGMERHLKTGAARVLGRRVEVTAMRADGTEFPAEIQIHRLDGIEGAAFAAYVRDLSEARRIEAEIALQREKLHQAEKLSAMGSLLAGLAHELNNPLAVVVAQASLMEELPEDPRNRERVGKVRRAADRCGRIVRSFLAMVRQQRPSRAPASLAAILDQALDLSDYGLRSSGIEVVRDYDPALPDLQLDADQIAQVVMNLVINAQHAMQARPGPRRIVVALRREPDFALVEIADTGPGVPDAMKLRIFEPFVTTKPMGMGTGIGLAVCRSIVDSHGGRIEVRDAEGGGAVFSLRLPLQPAARDVPVAPAAPAPAARRRLLVIDDEPDVGEALAGLLERDGHEVARFADIASALPAIADAPVALVFCDLHMPDGGALRLAEEMERRGLDPARRLVFVTGDMVSGPAQIAAATGRRDAAILAKPFDRDEIAAAMARRPD